MDFVVYDKNGNFIGSFNKYNIFFVDRQIKNDFLRVYYSKGFDSAVKWLEESGYKVEVIK